MIDKDLPKNERLYRIVGYPYSQRFLGQGIVTETNKDVWRHKRALLNPAFHRAYEINIISPTFFEIELIVYYFDQRNLADYLKQFNMQGDMLMHTLRTIADVKTTLTMLTYLSHATLDVIANVR
jgi:cholesterol 24(S)-hydroxylase